MHIIFLLCCGHKRNTEDKKVQQGSSVSASLYVSTLATSFRDHELPILFAVRGDLKTNTSVPRTALRLLSFETCPGQACALLTPESGADAELPAGSWREREICLSGRAEGNVGMSGWMEWRTGHVTPTLDSHVSVNVVTAIITDHMMKWPKVLTRSALILALRESVEV